MPARTIALVLAAAAVAVTAAAGGARVAARGGAECAALEGRAAAAAAEAKSAAESAGRMGFELRETKEELKLGYDLQIQNNGGNRVSITFTLADEGRIKPITSVRIGVPSADKSGYYDVVASLAPFEKDGKKIYVFQLTHDLAERGDLSLVTSTMDGKRMLDWCYHRVPFAAALKTADEKAQLEKAKELNVGGPTPAPATEKKP